MVVVVVEVLAEEEGNLRHHGHAFDKRLEVSPRWSMGDGPVTKAKEQEQVVCVLVWAGPLNEIRGRLKRHDNATHERCSRKHEIGKCTDLDFG